MQKRHTLVADLDHYWDAVLPDASHASLTLDGDHVTDEQRELVGLGADLLARAARAGMALVAAAAAVTPEDRAVVALLTAAIVGQKDLQTRRKELGLGTFPAPGSGVDLPLLAFPLHPDDIAVRALAHDTVQANRERAVLEAAQFQERDEVTTVSQLWLGVHDTEQYPDEGVTLLVSAWTPCVAEPWLVSELLAPAVGGVRLDPEGGYNSGVSVKR